MQFFLVLRKMRRGRSTRSPVFFSNGIIHFICIHFNYECRDVELYLRRFDLPSVARFAALIMQGVSRSNDLRFIEPCDCRVDTYQLH